MVTVGQSLTAPEAGWKRFDDTNSVINYSGNWLHRQNDGNAYGNVFSLGTGEAKVVFNFTGSKIRLIGFRNNGRSTATSVVIDGVEKGPIDTNASVQIHQVIDFESTELSNGEHFVVITADISGKSGIYVFDAIDIDTNGELKPYNPTPTPVISAPTNLTTTAGDSQVSLSWTAVTGATGYNVKRFTTAGGPYKTIAPNISGTSYVDTSVTNGITYYYVVSAINEYGESANSNEASATPVASSKALLRVTMIDSSEREYRLTTAEIDGFINWYTRTIGTGISCYALNDIVDGSKEYLPFEKIISFKVIPLTK